MRLIAAFWVVTNCAALGQVLQPAAHRPGVAPKDLGTNAAFYVPVTLETIRWGYLPEAGAKPALTVPSGAVVTIDTVSHEGLLEDQGRDPAKFFGRLGIAPTEVLHDAETIAASGLTHDFARDGPHVVIGPVNVEGADVGDVLRIDYLAFAPRVPYGVISNRHGKGALPGEFPEGAKPDTRASAQNPEAFRNVSTLVRLKRDGDGFIGEMTLSGGGMARFPAKPFLGTVGVTPASNGRTNSIPPGAFGGNLDIRYLTAGTTLYLPVQVKNAGLFVSDPHMAQGNGEVSLTAMEGSLRATMRLTVLKFGQNGYPAAKRLEGPFAETPDFWIVVGLDADLDGAMKNAVRTAVAYLAENHGMTRAEVLNYLSAAADFEVSQVVDRVKGIHVLIRKADFAVR